MSYTQNDMDTTPQYTLFAVANASRHELYVGYTHLPFNEFIERTIANPPRPMRAWSSTDEITFRSLDFKWSRDSVEHSLEAYRGSLDRKAWRVNVETEGSRRRRS